MFSFKKEVIVGFLSVFAVIVLVVYFIVSYSSRQNLNYSNTPITQSSQQVQQPVTLTIEEIKKHSSDTGCWFIVNNKVYDVTSYFDHPGGRDRIINYCGTDATSAYQTQDGKGSHSSEAQQLLQNFYIGDLNTTSRALPTKLINTIDSNRKERGEDDD